MSTNNNKNNQIIINYEEESQEEKLSRIRKLFQELDYDNTGFLDRENILKNYNKLKNHPFRDKYASELLEKCDVSSDGIIDFEEFKFFIEEKEKELWKLFLEIDKSRDMFLQPEELEVALTKAGIHCSMVDLKNLISLMDKDKVSLPDIYQYYEVVAQVSIDGDVIIPETNPRYLIAGALAGAVSRTATAPFDRLKIYLQTQTNLNLSPLPSLQSLSSSFLPSSKNIDPIQHKKNHYHRLNNIIYAIKDLYSSGGMLNFFRGNGLNVIKIAPESAIKFFAYEKIKGIVAKFSGTRDIESIGMSGRFLAGGFGGVISQFAIYPLETWKTRVMSSSGISRDPLANKNNNILLKAAKEMWNTQGIRSFYKGLCPSLIGVFPYAAIDLSIYEGLKLKYIKYKQEKSKSKNSNNQLKKGDQNKMDTFVSLGCGMISGSIAQGTIGHPQRYNNSFDVILKTYKKEKLRGFYKGLTPALTKVIPSGAITYMVYEKTKSHLELK
ncbi:2967_t:CDS:2 [Entrophospora sp. SA101]|nr:12946_t:CDS:2 [Entrophospora sp. SA101]CAJ0826107.1 2965_t:CDS:2 [Entrophospora sp. SA101]CAJ0826111.1 2967_t:CDS:2 [Entrophospora sp. SA101]